MGKTECAEAETQTDDSLYAPAGARAVALAGPGAMPVPPMSVPGAQQQPQQPRRQGAAPAAVEAQPEFYPEGDSEKGGWQ